MEMMCIPGTGTSLRDTRLRILEITQICSKVFALSQEEINYVVRMYWALSDNGIKGVLKQVSDYTGVGYRKAC